MKLSWIVLTLFLFSVASASTGCLYLDGERGDGNVVKEERKVSGFSELDVSGAFTVYITQGNEEKLILEADENLMEYIRTEVSGNTLEIYTKGEIRDYKEMNVYLTYKELTDIEISGAVELTTENRMKTTELDLEVSGAAELNMSIEAKEISADFSGASEVEFSGYTGELDIDVSGAGELDAYEMEADIVRLDVSGAATARVYAREELHIDASGASTVKYKGEPKVYSDVSGASSIKHY